MLKISNDHQYVVELLDHRCQLSTEIFAFSKINNLSTNDMEILLNNWLTFLECK